MKELVKRYNRIVPINGGIVLDMKFEDSIRRSAGGILLPETASGEVQQEIRARVLAVDTNHWTDERPCPVKPGDVVVVQRNRGVDMEFGAAAKLPTRKVVRIEDIVCRLDGYIVEVPA